MQDWIKDSTWLGTEKEVGLEDVVVYKRAFSVCKAPVKAELFLTACGMTYATLNGEQVTTPLTPGFDTFNTRIPYQVYDVTSLIKAQNTLRISVGRGWFGWIWIDRLLQRAQKRCVKGALRLVYANGEESFIGTDNSWTACRGGCISSDVYNGERYDATLADYDCVPAAEYEGEDLDKALLLHDGVPVVENERLSPVRTIITPKGELVLDFGQNVTGYVEFTLTANAGERLVLSHGEELDGEGNFYNENYRAAKALLTYVCRAGKQTYKPRHTFYGFRYVRVDEKPAGITADNFVAVVVHSQMQRTGYIRSANANLNRFCENTVWGQKGNFIDIPTDCPQRDERYGWTGDTQVFCKAATYNFDCEKFYRRWMRMAAQEQNFCGIVPYVVPDVHGVQGFSSAWSDAATIVPWTVYTMYGSKALLEEFFPVMQKHVVAITNATGDEFLWTKGQHFGDWLAPDGSSDAELLATAFYAYSTMLTITAGRILGKDVKDLETLYENIKEKFHQTYEPKTQTECAVTLVFALAEDRKAVTKRLVDKIRACGTHLETGFVGTPYLLHALSQNGESELAYELLLREEYPSWLYAVTLGATTVWERWDGKNEKGELHPDPMNSFNHYAYGAVVDWIYSVAGGITPLEAGFTRARIAPMPSEKLGSLEVKLTTRQGEIVVRWAYVGGKAKYFIKTPVETELVLEGKLQTLPAGEYCF